MSYTFTIESGKTKRLKTAGKYCDRDIVVTASGGGSEDLNSVLTEQDALIDELKELLRIKASDVSQYEVWTITYTDGTVEEKKVVLV